MGVAVLDRTTIEFLSGGCALIVGTVSGDGVPIATRAWGCSVLPGDDATVRLLLASDDTTTLEHVAPGGRIAITAADVRTLRSLQLKGRAVRVEPVTDADGQRAHAYVDAFFTDIEETDGSPRSVLERLVPVGYVACIVAVEELFDQTPGPRAGRHVDSGAST